MMACGHDRNRRSLVLWQELRVLRFDLKVMQEDATMRYLALSSISRHHLDWNFAIVTDLDGKYCSHCGRLEVLPKKELC